VVVVTAGRLLVDLCDITGTVRACVSVRGPKANPTIRRSRIRGGLEAGVALAAKAQGLGREGLFDQRRSNARDSGVRGWTRVHRAVRHLA
jgi:hypothetical protein